MNQEEKKVGLSLRAVGEEASRADVEAYKAPVSSSTTTLGDLMNWKRDSKSSHSGLASARQILKTEAPPLAVALLFCRNCGM